MLSPKRRHPVPIPAPRWSQPCRPRRTKRLTSSHEATGCRCEMLSCNGVATRYQRPVGVAAAETGAAGCHFFWLFFGVFFLCFFFVFFFVFICCVFLFFFFFF